MTLVLQGIAKAVGGEVHVHPTDLRLERGTMNVLLGPTLAGKTTLMRLMAGLDRPTAGRLLWDGRDVTGLRVQDRGVAMVYQQFINYPGLTVRENIASPLRQMRLPAAEIDARVARVADLMRLGPYLARHPLELSGGQQQRTALARALVKDARLVLLDEPLANLDYKLREELRAEIPRLFASSGSIFVYATTEPEEALLLGGNTATLWEGCVTQFGPTPQVYRRPADLVTARVFSDPPINLVPLERRGAEARLGEAGAVPAAGRLARLPEGAFTAGFRAGAVRLEAPSAEALRFEVAVTAAEITGSETFLHLAHGASRWVALVPGVRALPAGTRLPVWIDPARLLLFAPDGRLVPDALAPDPAPVAA